MSADIESVSLAKRGLRALVLHRFSYLDVVLILAVLSAVDATESAWAFLLVIPVSIVAVIVERLAR